MTQRPHCEATSACLPATPPVAYLFLVRRPLNVIEAIHIDCARLFLLGARQPGSCALSAADDSGANLEAWLGPALFRRSLGRTSNGATRGNRGARADRVGGPGPGHWAARQPANADHATSHQQECHSGHSANDVLSSCGRGRHRRNPVPRLPVSPIVPTSGLEVRARSAGHRGPLWLGPHGHRSAWRST